MYGAYTVDAQHLPHVFHAITTDLWTAASSDTYCGITSSRITWDWKFQTICLSIAPLLDKHTGENIGARVDKVLKTATAIVPQLSTVAATTDDGSNMIAAIDWNFRFPRIHCYAHNLHLALGDALRTVESLLDRVRYIVKLIRKSPKKTTLLRSHDKDSVPKIKRGDKEIDNPGRGLKLDVKTRWNSIYTMLTRLLEVKQSVTHLMSLKEVAKSFPHAVQLTPTEWRRIEELTSLLELCNDFTTKISGSRYPTLGMAHFYIRVLKRMVGDVQVESDSIKAFQMNLREALARRFDEESDEVILASFFDPRYKSLSHFRIKDSRSQKILDRVRNELTAVTQLCKDKGIDRYAALGVEKSNIPNKRSRLDTGAELIAHCSSKRDELDYYCQTTPIHLEENPLEWWKQNESRYPHLAILARKYLCVPATSVPSECLFSDSGHILSKRRLAMKPDLASDLTFMFYNSNMW